VNIGPLYGLGDPVREAFLTGLHAKYLQDRYLDTEISLSLPRMNEAEGHFGALHPLSDTKFVQFMAAFRLFLPRSGITISTRERASFRDRLVRLGATKMSAGSMTSVGGYTGKGTPQFEISDGRGVEEMASMIESQGYEPVYKDWEALV
jgi:2-iminoacetate synthase